MNENQKLLTWTTLIVMIGVLCFAPWEIMFEYHNNRPTTFDEIYSPIWRAPKLEEHQTISGRVRLRIESLLIELGALGLIYVGLFATLRSSKKANSN